MEKILKQNKIEKGEGTHQRNPEDAPVAVDWLIFLKTQRDERDAY